MSLSTHIHGLVAEGIIRYVLLVPRGYITGAKMRQRVYIIDAKRGGSPVALCGHPRASVRGYVKVYITGA